MVLLARSPLRLPLITPSPVHLRLMPRCMLTRPLRLLGPLFMLLLVRSSLCLPLMPHIVLYLPLMLRSRPGPPCACRRLG